MRGKKEVKKRGKKIFIEIINKEFLCSERVIIEGYEIVFNII